VLIAHYDCAQAFSAATARQRPGRVEQDVLVRAEWGVANAASIRRMCAYRSLCLLDQGDTRTEGAADAKRVKYRNRPRDVTNGRWVVLG
jgi:hypothetical protein